MDGLLAQPLAMLGDRNYRKPVWHLSLRAAPEDPVLTDEQWAQAAREVMARTGLARPEDEEAVRWVAVRHADDHIHIIATLARQDGERPDVWNDGYRVRDACRAIEERFGLRRTAPADRTAAKRPKRGETEKARRRGWAEPPRTALRRHAATAAAGARDEAEFFARLREQGALVRMRFSRRDPGEVTGYAVALPGDLAADGQPVWYGGGKLAADLTLPKLRHRWTVPAVPRPRSPLDPADRSLGQPRPGDYQPVSGRHLSVRSARAVLRTIVRQAADQTRTPEEFFEHLARNGVLAKQRFSEFHPGQITGYSVTLPDHTDPDGQPRWYGGGRLSDDLSWQRLEHRWGPRSTRHLDPEPAMDLTVEERRAFYEDAARAADYATAQVRRCMAVDPHTARDAIWAASDTLHVAAHATGNRHLRAAADAYDRAARAPYGRIPAPTPAGTGLRTAARLLAMTGVFGDQGTQAVMLLTANLITLIDTIAQLHQAEHRHAQAAAAQAAGRHLHQAGSAQNRQVPWLTQPAHAPTPVDLAMTAFPVPWAPAESPPAPDRSGRTKPPEPRRPGL
ncbi:hypothetical protein DPM19_09680 [Actinomadura craniellae]|uniref:MobA/VirD2-like nuclease domain-containing protein n=1 Tax=Actinomadura craniellae TaxID=2231787 RepID=A0A365H7F7_9ACTN|nr:relaxase/mobilization nuclease domain-containing protein [Actinomadura craniellae]RAY15011.1 hypothetical protein DPM19_09680 [Actinomadura craniellae]